MSAPPGSAEPSPVVRSDYGFPAPLWRSLERYRPPGLGRSRLWRSPLRGPWLTSVFGAVLLISLPIVVLTGLLDHVAYGPQARPVDVGWLQLPRFDWPTRPSWLFRLTQGLHVGLGLVLIPIVLAKLWSVVPRLFAWPPARSVTKVLERISLVALVGGILFETATGVLNIQYDYVFGFDFYTAHYYGGWVFIAGFVTHVVLKLGTMVKALTSRSFRAELRTGVADTHPEQAPGDDPDSLVPIDPAPATISRRGAVLSVVGASVLVALLTAGQTIGGWLRPAAVLMPRGRTYGDGPNDFPVNRTAVVAGIDEAAVGAAWRLVLSGTGRSPVVLDIERLSALPQHTAELPIACVEGWSTVQTWTGVRLRDLAALAGVPRPVSARVRSIERGGAFSQATLNGGQVYDSDSLLALSVNGEPLSLDHGAPARVIVPALPGVLCTKWVGAIEFRGDDGE